MTITTLVICSLYTNLRNTYANTDVTPSGICWCNYEQHTSMQMVQRRCVTVRLTRHHAGTDLPTWQQFVGNILSHHKETVR